MPKCNYVATIWIYQKERFHPSLEIEIIFRLVGYIADPGVASSILALSHIFVETDHEIIIISQ